MGAANVKKTRIFRSTGYVFDRTLSRSSGLGDSIGLAMRRIAREGTGAIVYIRRPGGGLVEMPDDKAMSLREYGIGAQILSSIGVRKIRLLSQSSKNLVALDGYGLEIVETVGL